MHRSTQTTPPAVALALAATITLAPAAAGGASLISSFDAGLGPLTGIAFDPDAGRVYVHASGSQSLAALSRHGELLASFPMPGNAGDALDLDLAVAPLQLGDEIVAAGTLLVTNGNDTPDTLYGVEPATGAVLAGLVLTSADAIGGADMPGADRLATVDSAGSGLIRIVDTNDGGIVSLVNPGFPVEQGDIDFAATRGTFLLVSNLRDVIRELDAQGACVRDLDLGTLGLSDLSGIGYDDTSGQAWLSAIDGTVYQVDLGDSSADLDGDGLADGDDNCTAAFNPDQRDSDGDGLGNACDADLDNDCAVNFIDLGEFKGLIFTADEHADFDGDGAVNFVDLGVMKARFFEPPGPSGIANLCSCSD